MFEDLDERIKSKSEEKEEKEKVLENIHGEVFDKFPVYVELKKRIANEIREINKYMNTGRSIQSKLVSKCNVFSTEEFKNVYEQYESISIYRLQEIIEMEIDAQHNIKIGDDDSFLY
jgi:hypothetical protein